MKPSDYGCCCKIADDGETILEWCACHAKYRKELEARVKELEEGIAVGRRYRLEMETELDIMKREPVLMQLESQLQVNADLQKEIDKAKTDQELTYQANLKMGDQIQELEAENQALKAQVVKLIRDNSLMEEGKDKLEAENQRLKELLTDAVSTFTHDHWDSSMRLGIGCQTCIKQREVSDRYFQLKAQLEGE